jgi:hypothetical protein
MKVSLKEMTKKEIKEIETTKLKKHLLKLVKNADNSKTDERILKNLKLTKETEKASE